MVLTDHKALEEWITETLDTPSGPLGRRLRWHLTFSKFNLEVGYISCKENMIADILSRWAYPASQAWRDVSKHGSVEDTEHVRRIKEQEERKEHTLQRMEKVCEGRANATGLQQGDLTLGLSPVGVGADGSAQPPLRFTFKAPRIPQNIGQRTRTESESSRKSPHMRR